MEGFAFFCSANNLKGKTIVRSPRFKPGRFFCIHTDLKYIFYFAVIKDQRNLIAYFFFTLLQTH